MAGGCSKIGSNMGCSRAGYVDSQTTDSTETKGRSNGEVFTKGVKTDETHVDDHLSECFQHSVTISGPSNRSCPVLSLKDTIRVSSMQSTTKFLKKQKSSDQQHGQKNVVKNSPNKTSKISSTARTCKRTSAQNQNDKPAQRTTPTRSSDNSELPSKRNQVPNSSSRKNSSQATKRSSIPETSIPSHVRKMIKPRRPVSQSKPSSRCAKDSFEAKERYSDPEAPIYYITLGGVSKVFDESLRISCPLCNKDLSTVPSDDEEYKYYDDGFEPSNFPDVSVLSCGHAFHSACLVNVTPDEQARDPPCFLCLSFMS